MKNLILPFFISISFFVNGQVVDTATVRVEVDSLIELNRSLIDQRKYEAALEVVQSAEKKCITAFGKETAIYGKIVFNIGRTYDYQRDLSKAESFYLKAKAIQEQINATENSDYASTLNNLGMLYFDLRQYEKAESFYLQTKEIEEKFLGKNHPDYASTLHNLGLFYAKIGQYEKAESFYLQSKDIKEKTLGKEHPVYARTLNNLGNLYRSMGQYEKTETFFLQTKHIREKAFGVNHPIYAQALKSLGGFYLYMGQYKKAESFYLQSKEIEEETLPREHPDYAMTLNNLGGLYSKIKQFQKAEPLYLQSKDIKEKIYGTEHPSYAQTLHNLGTMYFYMEQYDKAEPFYLQSKDIKEKSLGIEHPDYARTLHNLGNLYRNTGQYEKAVSFYSQSKNIWEKTLGKYHANYDMLIGNWGELYTKIGNYDKAIPLFLESIDIQKNLLHNAARHLSEKELLKYTTGFSVNQEKFASLAQTHSTLTATAYNNNLFLKGFLLNAIQKVSRLAQSNETSKKQYQKLKSYYRRLARQYSIPINKRKGVAELEEKANQLEKELTRTVAGFGNAIQQVTWQEVRSNLSPNQAAIEFVHYQFYNPDLTDSTMYAALILEPDSKQPKFIPLFEEKALSPLLEKTQTNRTEYIQNLYTADVDSETLSKLIFQPLEKELEGIETIYFSPSGLLHRLNLGAIHLNQKEILADRFNLIQLNSTRELVLADSSVIENQNAVLFGGIEYDFDSLALIQANADFTLENADVASRGEYDFDHTNATLRGGKWKFLKWTAVEVAVNEKILEAADFETNLKRSYEATEEVFRQIGAEKESPRILHLATHGFFYPDPESVGNKELAVGKEPVFKISEHPMIRSGLLLAGANRAWEGNPPLENMEDGILTAYEISQMNLSNTELVVLSACETGLGDIEGNEGVYGLQRAFKIAGAKHLMMSLWQVPDFQTQELMTSFYKNWLQEKMTIRAALQTAQQKIRAKYPNPFYWAGFVLVE